MSEEVPALILRLSLIMKKDIIGITQASGKRNKTENGAKRKTEQTGKCSKTKNRRDETVQYLKKKLQNQKISKRFSYTIVMVMAAFTAVILAVSGVVLYWSAIRKTEKEVQVNCDIIAMQIENVSDDVKNCLKILTKDINRIYHGDSVFGIDEVASVPVGNEIVAAMDYSRICFPDISALMFVAENERAVVSGKNTEISLPSGEEIQSLLRQVPKKGLASVKELRVEYFPFLTGEGPAWAFGHRVIDMNSGKNIGYLFAFVRSDRLGRYLPDTDTLGSAGEYQLIDETGKVLVSRDSRTLMEEACSEAVLEKLETESGFRIREQGKNWLITGSSVGKQGWKLVNKVNIYKLTREIRLLFAVILIAGVFCILIGVAVIRKIARWITYPIQELTEIAQQFQKENLDIRCNVNSTDEVGVLAGVFNEMLERIKYQMENIRQVQKQKRKYELALIQVQIKPHFLYNTLDLIYIFCQMKNAEGGARIAKALADYYRGCLSGGREIVTVEEEVKNIASYLLIQKERYSDRIDFSIDVSPEIYHCEIPKLTLQPLVENSIYHGLKSRTQREKGKVYVRGKAVGDLVCLEVEDDGAGMSEEVLGTLRQYKEEDAGNHFGVSSVHRRIQLYYGENYGIEIQSELGVGTKVVIRIPRRGQGDAEFTDR